MINVRLNDVCVRQRTRRRKRRLNCHTKIDADNLACSPTRRKQRVTPFAATTFEHYFVAKKLRRHGRYPAQKQFRVTLIFLREMLPLPTNPFGSRAFVGLDAFEIREARSISRRTATKFSGGD